jgi:hypothetical protein
VLTGLPARKWSGSTMEPGQRPAPLRQTKLHSPPTQLEIIRRADGIGRLNDGRHTAGAILRAAPAGFGKIALLSERDRHSRPDTTPEPHFSIYPFMPSCAYTARAVNKRPIRPRRIACQTSPRTPRRQQPGYLTRHQSGPGTRRHTVHLAVTLAALWRYTING